MIRTSFNLGQTKMRSDYEEVIREKIKNLGKILGFEVEEEWTPEPLKEESRQEVYIPKIDIVWYKKASPHFIKFLKIVSDTMKKKVGSRDSEGYLGVLPRYCDIDKEVIIGFELELTDRPTKYILGDIANLSRMCDYGFIIIRDIENLVKRSIKASKAFSLLHGASRVFVINLNDLEIILQHLRISDRV